MIKKVFVSKKGNLYVEHSNFKVKLRLYGTIEELTEDPNWRERVSLREGSDDTHYCVLAKEPLEELDL